MEIKDKKLHRVALTAIVRKEGKYLLLRRGMNEKAFPGRWTVPGGNLETDDYVNLPPTTKEGQWYNALEASLRREVREETGLEMEKVNYLTDITFVRPDGFPAVILSYWADYKEGDVRLDNDSIDYAWVTTEEAEKYDLIEGILDEIKMVDKINKEKINIT